MKTAFPFFCILFCLSSCSLSGPHSKTYTPEKGSFEAKLLENSRADLFPDDVRKDIRMYREQLVVWTGIVKRSFVSGAAIVTDYEHHYWDFVEDYGPQKERVFLSPKGEGNFRCIQKVSEFGGKEKAPLPPAGYLAIVYGVVDRLDKDGTVLLRCPPLTKTLGPEKFATDIWTYGRDYVVHGNKSDFKVLRVPGPGL